MREFVRKTIKTLVQGGFVVTVLPLLYLLDPFYKLRFCLIPNQRIGHQAANTDTFLRHIKKHGVPPRTKYIFLIWAPANQQLADMFKRELTVWQSRLLVRLHYAVQNVIERTRFMIIIKGDSHPYTHAANTLPAVLSFTEHEQAHGSAVLRKMGIGPDDWFVCFHGRDLGYLNAWRPQYSHLFRRTEYRNSNDHDYMDAARFIAEQGGYALRMGAYTDETFRDDHDRRIIDVSKTSRSDFMDIYLPGKCRFFIGTNSGYGFVPTLFNTPQGMVNMVPPCRIPAGPRDMFIPKLLHSVAENRFLTFAEMHGLGFFRIGLNHEIPDICKSNGLEIVDNTPAQIVDLCRDLIDQDEGRTPTPEQGELQRLFYDRFLSSIDGFEVVGARLGARFAEAHKDLIVN